MRSFGSIPYEVVMDTHDYFPAGRMTGDNIAAIKCLLIFGLRNDFYSKEVSLSLSEIEDATGCSKPMVVRGINQLISKGIVTKIDQGKTNIKNKYVLNFPSQKFTQIPYNLFFKLKEFPNKGVTALVALKAYLILLKFRQNATSHTELSYSGFSKYGINTKHLSKALAVLISSDYISIFKQYNRDETGYNKSCNNYKICHFYKTVPAPNNRPYLDLESID